MTKLPSLNYEKVIKTVPAHKPIKRSTLSHILKLADLSIQRFLEVYRY